MIRPLLLIASALLSITAPGAEPGSRDLEAPPHSYYQRTLRDRFTRIKDDVESGKIALDRHSEKAFVISLLRALGIPATSQMLVFSTTSLQLRLISPASPRALYFTEDLYIGYVPGGRIEVVSLDPELGAIFYIFDIPRGEQPVRVERSTRCMNCHAAEDTGQVPGLVVKSVVPGPTGGSLDSFRREQTGHAIPFDQRFGGWYVTGGSALAQPWANVIGRLFAGNISKQTIPPGTLFDFAHYPVATSDLLPQLLLEHQAGFVNRVVAATYRARTHLHTDQGVLSAEHAAELDEQARIVTRYLLFADEVPLPPGGVEGDAAFKTDFLRDRRSAANGISLKDFDLRTRLLQHRCSYMIYSAVWQGLPPAIKERIYRRLRAALDPARPEAEYAYLPTAEKQSIRAILRATLTDLPGDW
ncbi:MAG: hypothetical protein QOE70_1338 [Chthoniobacter sp.]|jgi:hypothetical protein|nr:hypothetical protein [Chthoniobacter sp.]